MYLNFHTHQVTEDNTIELYNIDLRKGPLEFEKGDYQCIGLHPWWLTPEYLEKLETFKEVMTGAEVLCIGEIGLDRACNVDFDLQLKVFRYLLKVAKQRNDAFVIIHCVKAYSEVIQCTKESGFTGRLVFHDYNGDSNTTKDLIKKGCYFSYGNMLYKESSKGFKSLNSIPLERIFIETDDQKKFSIKEAYERVSVIKRVTVKDLKKIILSNFKNIKKLSQ
jgi:TatD DNase family protein